jgi:hypothetical protein
MLSLKKYQIYQIASLEAERHPQRLGFTYLSFVFTQLSNLPNSLLSSSTSFHLLKILRALYHPISLSNSFIIRLITSQNDHRTDLIILKKFKSEYELCSLRHIIKACTNIISHEQIVEESYLSYTDIEGTKVYYLKLLNLSFQERLLLKKQLPNLLERALETVQKSCLLPINEEDALYNILLLKERSDHGHNISHVIIDFHNVHEAGLDLIATIIPSETSLQDRPFLPPEQLIQKISIEPRVQNCSHYALVILITCPIEVCQNQDFSLHFLKARSWAIDLLKQRYGTIRDVNGGLFMQQIDFFSHLERHLMKSSPHLISLAKKLYTNLLPPIMKNLLSLDQCARGCELVEQLMASQERYLITHENPTSYLVIREHKKNLSKFLELGKKAGLEAHEFAVSYVVKEETCYYLIYLCPLKEEAKQRCIKACLFLSKNDSFQ